MMPPTWSCDYNPESSRKRRQATEDKIKGLHAHRTSENKKLEHIVWPICLSHGTGISSEDDIENVGIILKKTHNF